MSLPRGAVGWSVICNCGSVSSQTFAIILFSRIALKDILATFKIRNYGVISPFREAFIFAKLRENRTLANISEFTAFPCPTRLFFKIILTDFKT